MNELLPMQLDSGVFTRDELIKLDSDDVISYLLIMPKQQNIAKTY